MAKTGCAGFSSVAAFPFGAQQVDELPMPITDISLRYYEVSKGRQAVS